MMIRVTHARDDACTLVRMLMGWLRWVGSLKVKISNANKPYKRHDILPKRPVILRSLLIVAIPYRLLFSMSIIQAWILKGSGRMHVGVGPFWFVLPETYDPPLRGFTLGDESGCMWKGFWSEGFEVGLSISHTIRNSLDDHQLFCLFAEDLKLNNWAVLVGLVKNDISILL